MTKIMVPTCGWMYLTVVLDGHTKKIVGYDLGHPEPGRRLAAGITGSRQRPVSPRDPRQRQASLLVSDNGSQPTSKRFMKDCSTLNIKQISTSYNNPKGNADTERVMRTIKEDLVWPHELLTA